MTHTLAAEGGYQAFTLGGGETAWLVFALLAGLGAIGVGIFLARGVLAADQGTPTMRQIAAAIQEGAMAFLRRQFRVILIIVVPLAVLVFLTATKVVRPDGSIALSFGESGLYRALAFLAGATSTTGFDCTRAYTPAPMPARITTSPKNTASPFPILLLLRCPS